MQQGQLFLLSLFLLSCSLPAPAVDNEQILTLNDTHPQSRVVLSWSDAPDCAVLSANVITIDNPTAQSVVVSVLLEPGDSLREKQAAKSVSLGNFSIFPSTQTGRYFISFRSLCTQVRSLVQQGDRLLHILVRMGPVHGKKLNKMQLRLKLGWACQNKAGGMQCE